MRNLVAETTRLKMMALGIRSKRVGKGVLCVVCCATLWTVFAPRSGDDAPHNRGRVTLAEEEGEVECIPSGIDAFPPDFMTQEQRRSGGVVVHVVIVCYVCAMLAVLCDDHFVPALETIVERLKLSPDVAGATFMAMGASAPELFSSIAGSFITEGDIGLGTILGSAVFNILGISGIVGLVLWNEALPIQWYPVARDCVVYGTTVLLLSLIIADNVVMWWEALALLTVFAAYIVLMHFNSKIERAVKNAVGTKCCCTCRSDPEKGPLLDGARRTKGEGSGVAAEDGVVREGLSESDAGEEEEETSSSSCCLTVWRLLMWVPSLVFRLTIPPVRYFPATFLLSIAWMGALSYVAVWMVTVVGYTLSIPDAASGLTLLAAGSSVPDLVATVLIAKSGQANMAISNLLGSNTFDLAFCLGAPWFVKSLTSRRGRLLVYSSAMAYTAATLLLTLVALLLTFRFTAWTLNRTSGFVCITLYALCITLALLYELNVFGEINKPTCF